MHMNLSGIYVIDTEEWNVSEKDVSKIKIGN